MKKTLIALAAVAVSSAAMAQVTISGGIAYGYQSTTTAGAKDGGLGVDTAGLTFAASEDLGNGTKLSGEFSVGGMARGEAVGGEDMKITLSGGFGSVTVGALEIGSGIRGLAQAGAPVNNMEGEVLAAAVTYDYAGYAIKAGDFTVSASVTEDATDPGLGGGLAGADNYATTVGAAYASGPLSVKFDASVASTPGAGTMDNRYRLSGSFDLGVAKIGAGIESQNLQGGGERKLTMVGVSVPMGKVTLGGVIAMDDTSATAGSKSGYSVGAKYALSPRTNVTANTALWDATEGGTVTNKKSTVLLNHSF